MLINIALVALFSVCVSFGHHPLVLLCLNGIIVLTLLVGVFFFFGTSIGILRFPDFFTRLHAAGKADTFSTILILLGSALYVLQSAHHLDGATVLTAIKILLIINFIFIGSPTATHALIEAGFNSEIKPWDGGEPK